MQEENSPDGIQGIVKQGPVKVKTAFGVWKKRWLVFQKATSYGPTRLVVCSKRESFIKHPFGKKNHNVVFMRDVNNISKGVTKHGEAKVTIGFNIAKPHMEFICLAAHEDYWVECLGLGKGKEDTLDEDSFRAYLLPAISLNFSGECVLQIRNRSLALCNDEIKRDIIVKWPIEVIRRFSKDPNNKIFFLETGRMSTTGECLLNIRSYWFEEMFKKIVQAQVVKIEPEPVMSFTANDFDYDKTPAKKTIGPNNDSDDDDYLHPIPGELNDAQNDGYIRAVSVRKEAGRNRCKMTNDDGPYQRLDKSLILSADQTCYLSVRDSTFKLELEKKEESPYLCMNSGLTKETKSDDDGAARTSRSLSDTETDAQISFYGRGQISSSVGSVYYRDPEVFCNTNPPPAPHNMKRQSHQLKDTNEGVPLYADKQKDELVLGNETENLCEEEVAYLGHDPMPIPQLPQRRSFKSSDNVPSPFTLLREGDDSSSDDSDDYLTPIPDLVTMHLKRSNSARPAPSTHVNPTVNRSSFA